MTFARPADADTAAQVDGLWFTPPRGMTAEAVDQRIAGILGLGAGEFLCRCETDGCGAYYWSRDGGVVGADVCVCPEHAPARTATKKNGVSR